VAHGTAHDAKEFPPSQRPLFPHPSQVKINAAFSLWRTKLRSIFPVQRFFSPEFSFRLFLRFQNTPRFLFVPPLNSRRSPWVLLPFPAVSFCNRAGFQLWTDFISLRLPSHSPGVPAPSSPWFFPTAKLPLLPLVCHHATVPGSFPPSPSILYHPNFSQSLAPSALGMSIATHPQMDAINPTLPTYWWPIPSLCYPGLFNQSFSRTPCYLSRLKNPGFPPNSYSIPVFSWS